jgi:uroporphyrinogen decarboxylase
MNPRERVRIALACQIPDRIPRALGFYSQSVAGIAAAAADDHFGLDVRFAEFAPPEDQDAFLDYLGSLPQDIHLGSPAQLRTYLEWGYHPERGTRRPLDTARSVAEAAEFVIPRLTEPARHAHLAGQVARWHARGLAVAGSPPHLGGELFETAWRLRGFDNFLVDLASRKDIAHYLLDQLAAMLQESAVILARAGVDVLLLDDDVAMPGQLMISPAIWREFFKPRLARVIATARETAPELLVFYHSDGNFTQLVADLVEIGVNVIHPVQPDCMDALAIKREFGRQLALWGTIGTARLWDQGTPGEIRSEVRRRLAELGPGGLLAAPAYDIDFVPAANIEAFVEAVDEFGRQ